MDNFTNDYTMDNFSNDYSMDNFTNDYTMGNFSNDYSMGDYYYDYSMGSTRYVYFVLCQIDWLIDWTVAQAGMTYLATYSLYPASRTGYVYHYLCF